MDYRGWFPALSSTAYEIGKPFIGCQVRSHRQRCKWFRDLGKCTETSVLFFFWLCFHRYLFLEEFHELRSICVLHSRQYAFFSWGCTYILIGISSIQRYSLFSWQCDTKSYGTTFCFLFFFDGYLLVQLISFFSLFVLFHASFGFSFPLARKAKQSRKFVNSVIVLSFSLWSLVSFVLQIIYHLIFR